MSTAQESINAMQSAALEAVKSGQSAAVEATQAWSRALSQLAPSVPAVDVHRVTDAFGDPAAIVDSVYDFAAQLLELNKQFVHSLLEVSETTATAVENKVSNGSKSAKA